MTEFSNDRPIYRATLIRPRETIFPFVLNCGDITVKYYPGEENGAAHLCQLLIEAGNSDGELRIVEVKVKPEYAGRCTIQSILQHSKLPRILTPQPKVVLADSDATTKMSKNAYDALTSLIADPTHWNSLGGRSRSFLTQHGLAIVFEKIASVTERGLKAHASFTDDAFLSAVQREALALCPIDLATWTEKVHHLCRKTLVDRGWVTVTNGAVSALSEDAIRQLVEDTAQAPVAVNPKWIAVLTQIKTGTFGRRDWDDLHHRSKTGLLNKKLIIVSEVTGKPSLTPTGIAMLTS